jgi:hypothetical protein
MRSRIRTTQADVRCPTADPPRSRTGCLVYHRSVRLQPFPKGTAPARYLSVSDLFPAKRDPCSARPWTPLPTDPPAPSHRSVPWRSNRVQVPHASFGNCIDLDPYPACRLRRRLDDGRERRTKAASPEAGEADFSDVVALVTHVTDVVIHAVTHIDPGVIHAVTHNDPVVTDLVADLVFGVRTHLHGAADHPR